MSLTIAHAEIGGHPREERNRQGFKATRQLRCAWSDRQALTGELLSGSGHEYPYGVSAARARRVTLIPFGGVKGDGNGNETATYDEAHLTVEYSTPGFDGEDTPEEVDEQLVSERVEPSIEAIRLPVRESDFDDEGNEVEGHPLFRWSGGRPLDENEAPVRQIRQADYIVTFYEVTSIPNAVFSLQGHTNNASVVSNLLGTTFAAGTLLYYGPSLSRSTTSAGTGAWTLTERYGIRWEGWNQHWQVDSADWQSIQRWDGSSWEAYNNFPLGNFALL